jgi:hypothetical protein
MVVSIAASTVGRKLTHAVTLPQLAAHSGPPSLSRTRCSCAAALRTGQRAVAEWGVGRLCGREDLHPGAPEAPRVRASGAGTSGARLAPLPAQGGPASVWRAERGRWKGLWQVSPAQTLRGLPGFLAGHGDPRSPGAWRPHPGLDPGQQHCARPEAARTLAAGADREPCLGAEHPGLLAAEQRLVAGPDRDLVQHLAAEGFAAESFRKTG